MSLLESLQSAHSLLAAGTVESLEMALGELDQAQTVTGPRILDRDSAAALRRELACVRELVNHGANYWNELAVRRGHSPDAAVQRTWEG